MPPAPALQAMADKVAAASSCRAAEDSDESYDDI
jgi:hypothetical protein